MPSSIPNPSMSTYTFAVGLEEGAGGATLVHALTLPGCVASGPDRHAALDAFPTALAEWLHLLEELGEEVPSPETELEIAVDEWVVTDAEVSQGTSRALFEADLPPLSRAEIQTALRRLGELRGLLLRRLRQLPDAELDRMGASEWTARRVLDELARAQWWTLTRLGASPLGEVPVRTLGRLDTAMALVVQRITELDPGSEEPPVEIDGELWTPRKVLRRLLWLEWTLGREALLILPPSGAAA